MAYGGPTSLAYSRFASPGVRKAQLAAVPAAVSSTPTSPANTIATREQIAASNGDLVDNTTENGGAQLAAARGKALKEDVEKYAAKLSNTVSTAVTNTRQLLEVVREAVNKKDATALKTVDELWTELELLFEATKGSKAALAHFLEKQRNNMALYHSSIVNETYRETQDQLDMERKKSNVQHNLILEQQQAFMDHKEQTATKLKEIEVLEEKASRLTLANGHYKGELDDYKKKLQHEESTKQEDLKKTADLREEVEKLVAAKKQFLAETEGLRKTVDELEEKNQTTERRLTDKFVGELKEKSDQLEKEIAKISHLNKSISTLQERENSGRNEMAKLRAETKQLNEKFANMATEHSRAFQKNNELNKKIDSQTAEIQRLRKDNVAMTERLKQIPELEKKNTVSSNENAGLLEQVGNLSMELKDAKETNVEVNKAYAAATELVAKHKYDRDMQKIEHDDLVAKLADSEKTNARLADDKAKLQNKVAQLEANQAASAVTGGPITSAEKAAFEQKITALEEKNAKSQSALSQWQKLAKDSYNEYKEMLPLYKEAEQIRSDAMKKDEEIKTLKTELSKAKTSQPSGGGAGGAGGVGGESAYWKGKYENLLASVGN